VDESLVGETIAFKWNVGWHAAEIRQMLHNNKCNFEVYYPEDDERRDHNVNLTCSNCVLGEEIDVDTAPTGHWVLLKERP
jgi:hypothetical protein